MAKDLVVLDTETTGTDITKDFIIQFAAIKIRDGKIIDKIKTYVNPGNDKQWAISIGAQLVHRITREMAQSGPTWKEIGHKIIKFLEGCDILTYNGIKFDLPLMQRQFKEIGINWNPMDYVQYDSYKEECIRNSNKLGSTFERYYGQSMEDKGLVAHDALSDIKATYGVYVAQNKVKKVEPIKLLVPDNIITIQQFNGRDSMGHEFPCFNIGKYAGIPVALVKKIDPSYIEWTISDKCKFCQETKEYIKKV